MYVIVCKCNVCNNVCNVCKCNVCNNLAVCNSILFQTVLG